jgi:hypothetical protein
MNAVTSVDMMHIAAAENQVRQHFINTDLFIGYM